MKFWQNASGKLKRIPKYGSFAIRWKSLYDRDSADEVYKIAPL